MAFGAKTSSVRARARAVAALPKYLSRLEDGPHARLHDLLAALCVLDTQPAADLGRALLLHSEQALHAPVLGGGLTAKSVLARHVLGALEPSAAFQRRLQALHTLQSFPEALHLACMPALLLNIFTDGYDSNRELAYAALLAAGQPLLRGFDTAETATALAQWAMSQLNRPFLRERDGAALVLRLLVAMYVRGSGWRLDCDAQRHVTLRVGNFSSSSDGMLLPIIHRLFVKPLVVCM